MARSLSYDHLAQISTRRYISVGLRTDSGDGLGKTKNSMGLITLRITKDIEVAISPSKRGILIKQVLEGFINKYMPQGEIFFLREASHVISYTDEADLKDFRIPLEKSDMFPDIIIYDGRSIVLGLIEVAVAKGPVTMERKKELEEVFKEVKIPLAFFSAFSATEDIKRFSSELAPGTAIWTAEEPDQIYLAKEKVEDTAKGPSQTKSS
jgi:hypothetical protein